jgi:signal transduction histidine kinase/ligand-binding sensor domain-containing protein/CheY-like chemotaxis protein
VSSHYHRGVRRAPFLAALVCLTAAGLGHAADSPPLILEHLTTADGLPQGTVFVTLQDSQGFIWLGTEDGLVRYDGHELLRYAYSRNTRAGLPGNYIQSIVEDRHHDLWIAIKDAGVARWSRATDSFEVYQHRSADPNTIASNAVHELRVDPRGLIWVTTTDAGVDILDPDSRRVRHLRHDPRNARSLIDDRTLSLMLDRHGTMWIGTRGGLDRWQGGGFAHIGHSAAGAAAGGGEQISRVIEDPDGTLWVGTHDGGLERIDPEGGVLERFRHDAQQPNSLSSDDVHAILQDQSGHLWVGTADGLDLLNRSTGQFSHYRHDASDAGSLRDSYIMSLYQDETGLVWIGTRAGGVSRWNPRSWEFGAHRPAWLGDRLVTAFADASDNRVWIATLGGGLMQFDADSGRAVSLESLLGRPDPIGDQRVMSLRQDHAGNLWIGTMGSGLRKLRPDGGLESFTARPAEAHSLSAPGIMTIQESRSGQIWIGTFGGGANILDPLTGSIRRLAFGSAPGAISSANVSAIAEDSRGYFWIGTDGGGLDLVRANGTLVRVFRHAADDPGSLPANTVYSVAIDAHQRVWAATDGGGLAQVIGSPDSPESIRFKTLSRENGLASDTIYGVLSDVVGHLWLSTDAGLMRLDPETRSIKTYHREHGLQGEEFDSGAFFRLRDGRLCFGGPGGFNIFDPLHLTESRQAPRLALTRVEIMGVPAAGPKPYWLRERIDLDYRDNILSLDFGALDFTSPKRNRLAYRMGGLTDRWIDLGEQHRITLTNLEPGDHLLEVSAANADSLWSQTPLRLMIHRDPAPWRSSFAYMVYALAVLALIFYRWRLQRMRFARVVRERARLESEVALRTCELVDSNRQLEEAVQAKSNFMDRMSHELRTPMNGVVGMTELLARTSLSSTQAQLTQTIRSSAQVLLQIVNDLLDLSKINAGKVQLEALPIELTQLLEDCTSLFMGAAESKGIDLIACPPHRQPAELLGDPLRLRQILMNLIGNAVKFTSRGEIVVTMDVELIDTAAAMLDVSVTDTGIGMDAATIARIFKPFTQADESTTRKFGGTGLGLAICRELAVVMGGNITVESRPQIGSTFHLAVPLKARAAQPPAEKSSLLPHRSVRIITRRPALAESLSRYVSGFGVTAVLGDDEAANSIELVIVDASADHEYLRPAAGEGRADQRALVIVATAAECAAKDLERVVGMRSIVLKPVRGLVLRQALAAAMGVAESTPGPALSAPSTETPIGGHVLLVEDEAVNAAVAQGYLTALGCTCVWVKDGPEAVARNAAERFDLILMDLSMPTMDGFAATALIRQRMGHSRHIPIIALTAHDPASYRDTCRQADMDDLLSKPCTLSECARVLRRWIPSWRAARARGAGTVQSPQRTELATTQPMPSASATGDLADVDASAVRRLRNLRGGASNDLYERLVELFQSGSVQAMAQLGAALERQDLKDAAAICHKLGSSAANVGALAFAQEVRSLEHSCVAGDATRARATQQRLQQAQPALLQELTSIRMKASA